MIVTIFLTRKAFLVGINSGFSLSKCGVFLDSYGVSIWRYAKVDSTPKRTLFAKLGGTALGLHWSCGIFGCRFSIAVVQPFFVSLLSGPPSSKFHWLSKHRSICCNADTQLKPAMILLELKMVIQALPIIRGKKRGRNDDRAGVNPTSSNVIKFWATKSPTGSSKKRSISSIKWLPKLEENIFNR